LPVSIATPGGGIDYKKKSCILGKLIHAIIDGIIFSGDVK
jgi:hypothetical protein